MLKVFYPLAICVRVHPLPQPPTSPPLPWFSQSIFFYTKAKCLNISNEFFYTRKFSGGRIPIPCLIKVLTFGNIFFESTPYCLSFWDSQTMVYVITTLINPICLCYIQYKKYILWWEWERLCGCLFVTLNLHNRSGHIYHERTPWQGDGPKCCKFQNKFLRRH